MNHKNSVHSAERKRKVPALLGRRRLLPIPALFAALIILALLLVSGSACRDIVFNNPLDPNASRDVLKIVKIFETSLSGAGDMMFDGEKLWKIDAAGSLTALDRESGIVIRSFVTDGGTGTAFFQDAIYICNGRGDSVLVVVDPLSGDVLNRLNTTRLSPGYLAVDGDRLLIYDMRSSGIFRYDPGGGSAERLFAAAGINVGGMAAYRDGLLITDMNTDSIYYFSLSGEVRRVFSSPAPGVGGVAVDSGNYVFLFSLSGKIYKVSLP